ncbi:TraR/DksA family transcriptional regulator [Massilia antarctica]|uniref:TraR/DksA family transcriptional regulator n=1 Tax=Massilia antarctica TaxID=2765360 RepID=A0AA48WA22_9BURK|nr:TraR/DksA family transcriptional regulator [Massilia antarctica]QPI47729.1 TraR/DksA family transcriptional regulator [Massilia antarctica]
MHHLTDDDIKQFDAQLRGQRDAVQAAIAQRLHQAGDPDQLALANHFADVREQAEADLLGDTDIGQLQLELADLKAIDDALARIAGGAYGDCAGCGAPIALPRLRAQPAAPRCLTCQEALEKQHPPVSR